MKLKIRHEIFMCLIYFFIIKQLKLYLIMLLFILLHELGHLTIIVLLNLEVDSININPLGCYIEMKQSIKKKNSKIKTLISIIAGPVISLILIIIYKNNINFLNIDIELGYYSNMLILLFNLIPIYPMDGGRFLKEILLNFFSKGKSLSLINAISNFFAIILTMVASVLILLYKNWGIIIAIIYIWKLIYDENKKYKLNKRIYRLIETNM